MSNRQTMNELAASDLHHRLAKMVALGTIAECDYDKARVKVEIGDWTTSWLPWLTNRAMGDIDWQAPELGEQVVLLSPCGDMAQGIVLGGIYQGQQQNLVQDIAKEKRDTIHRVRYQDGSTIEYNRESHRYLIDIKGADATVDVVSAGTLNITTTKDIKVETQANAKVTAAQNVTVDGASIALNGGAPCVTTAHICHFTGSPHGDGSSTVTAGK